MMAAVYVMVRECVCVRCTKVLLLRNQASGKQEQSVANKQIVNQVVARHKFIRHTSTICDPFDKSRLRETSLSFSLFQRCV